MRLPRKLIQLGPRVAPEPGVWVEFKGWRVWVRKPDGMPGEWAPTEAEILSLIRPFEVTP